MTSWRDWKYCSCIRPCFVYCLKPCFSALGNEFGFKDCKRLDFSHCNLKEVPDEIFSLERTLEELLLDVNSIRDLPRVVFHCTGLKKLSLSDNEIETLPNAISSLVYLEYLNLSRNSLLVIPDGIKCCKCLIVLDCSVNPLGKVPDSLTQLINLQELYLNDTFLEYLPANFGRLSRLRIVELRENNLKLLPKSFQRLVNLERLDVGQNELVEFPEVLCNLTNLQELWIDGNRVSSLPEMIGNLTKLNYLDASENRIVTVADRLSACALLTDLLLSGNKIVELPETIGSLKNLTYLRLDDNQLTCLPQTIGGLSSLQELVISNNAIQSLPKNIGFLRNLHSLIMDSNHLSELPDTICSCSKLRLLSVASNDLSELPEDIGRLCNLKVLNLRNNQLRYLPYSFANITNLRTLWLSDNQQKPIMKLQTDTDEVTNQKVLTCFLLPQQVSSACDESYVSDHEEPSSSSKSETKTSGSESRIKFYSVNGEIDEKEDQFISKLVRNPTPYPKELKAHARHARNLALKRRDSFGNEADDEGYTQSESMMYQHQHKQQLDNQTASSGSEKTGHGEIKEARLTKPTKSDLESTSHPDGPTYGHSFDYHPHSLTNQEESTMIGNHQQSTNEKSEFPVINQTIPSTRIQASTINSLLEGKVNFHRQFRQPYNDDYSTGPHNRPGTIYNSQARDYNPSSSSSQITNYRGAHENTSQSQQSIDPVQHQLQQSTLERQLQLRNSATYLLHREPKSNQYAILHSDGSSSPSSSMAPSNPLIGFNDSNRSSIKNLSFQPTNLVGYNMINAIKVEPHVSNFTGTSNKSTFRNQPLNPVTHPMVHKSNNHNSINLPEGARANHFHYQQHLSQSPNYPMNLSPSQQQSTRTLISASSSREANHSQQLILTTPTTTPRVVSTTTQLTSTGDSIVDRPFPLPGSSLKTSSDLITNSPNTSIIPSQLVYKQFKNNLNQPVDYGTTIYRNQQSTSRPISSTQPNFNIAPSSNPISTDQQSATTHHHHHQSFNQQRNYSSQRQQSTDPNEVADQNQSMTMKKNPHSSEINPLLKPSNITNSTGS